MNSNNSYMRLDAWILANIIQLATFDFCRRFVIGPVDPTGRQFDQMTQAARSVQSNIAEGSARTMTSKEDEMKLLDVARASLAELNGDFTFWLMRLGVAPWERSSPDVAAIFAVRMETPRYGADWTHESCKHILAQKAAFDRWLNSEDDKVVANAILILVLRCIHSLNHLLEHKLEEFKLNGGFREKLSHIRLEERDRQESATAPTCPMCGKPMRKRLAQRGANAGKAFWSCRDYPACRGTRPCC